MSLAENEVFKIMWKIENFSMCPHKCGEHLESPGFVVEMLEKTEWRLMLYPRGETDEKYISCFLKRMSFGTSSIEKEIDFHIIMNSVGFKQAIRVKGRHTFQSNERFGYSTFVLRNIVICEQRDGFLPNDTLTLMCHMWRTGNDSKNCETEALDIAGGYDSVFKTALSREILRTASRDNFLDFKSQFGSNRVYTRTQIKVTKKIFFWPIRKFSSLRTNQRLSIPLTSPLKDLPSFYLTFYLTDLIDGDQCAEIEIRRQEIDHSHGTFVKCRISVRNIQKTDQYFIEETHLFEPQETEDTWKLPPLVKLSKLIKDKYFDITQDVLFLRFYFTFAFYQFGDKYEAANMTIIDHSHESTYFNIPNPVKNEFKNFYRDGEFSDVKLQVGDRVFMAHKIILSVKSTVFSAMFKQDMKEKETGIVEITDLSANTVDRMLTYMYTDVLDDLNPKDALELYSAANKYELLPLKLRCSRILKSTLSLANMWCDILILADLHHDDDLKLAAQQFISINYDKTLNTPEWKNLMQCNLSLASDLMFKMLVRKMD